MDIDIDVKTSFTPKELFDNTITHASIVENGKLKKHIVGNYFQNVPTDPITGLAAIPYDKAEQFGFIKIDILHLSVLDIFESKKEIKALLKKEPDWSLLLNKDVVSKLFHLSNHYDILKQIKPTCVLELADTLALIRPNKLCLIDKYIKDRDNVRKQLYTKTDKSDLRKSHAIPYALLIVLQLHLIQANII